MTSTCHQGVGNTEHTPPMVNLDACPNCVTNTEIPYHVTAIPNGHRSFYRCSDCGWRWHTNYRSND